MTFRLPALVRDYAALSGSELVSKIAGFVAFAYLARVLEPSAYGTVEFAVSLSMLGMLIVDFGLGPIGAREIATRPADAAVLAREIPALRMLLALVGLAAMLACAVAVGRSDAMPLVALFGVGLFGVPWTLGWLLQGLDLTRWVGPAQVLRMGVFAVGLVVFVARPEHLLRVGGVEIAAAAAVAGYYVWAVRGSARPLPRFAPSALSRLLREAAPVGTGQLCWALSQFGPTVVVASLLASEQVAFFGAAHRILLGLGSFVFLYFFNLYPSLVRAIDAGRSDFERTGAASFRLLAWLGPGVALAGARLAEPVCAAVYGERFAPAGSVLGVLVWIWPITMLSGHARFALIGSGHQRRELVAEAAGAVTTLGLCLVLVPAFGIRGAGVAMLCSAAVVWGVAHRSAVRHVGALPSWGPLVRPGLAVALAWGASVALGLGSPWLDAALVVGAYAALAALFEARALKRLLDGATRRRAAHASAGQR